jgi:hypothetical protein
VEEPQSAALCTEVEAALQAAHSAAALAAEFADDEARTWAARDDVALVRYQDKWARKVRRLQRAHPQRWHVAELSAEEVRDALTLRLLELIRCEAESSSQRGRAGKEWGLCVVERRLAELRSAFRLPTEPTDFRVHDTVLNRSAALDRRVGVEESWLELEADACRLRAQQSAEQTLSVPERRWYSALKLAARGGAFFQSSSELNLSAASRVLGKNRSSAVRAYRVLQSRFQRERERIG